MGRFFPSHSGHSGRWEPLVQVHAVIHDRQTRASHRSVPLTANHGAHIPASYEDLLQCVITMHKYLDLLQNLKGLFRHSTSSVCCKSFAFSLTAVKIIWKSTTDTGYMVYIAVMLLCVRACAFVCERASLCVCIFARMCLCSDCKPGSVPPAGLGAVVECRSFKQPTFYLCLTCTMKINKNCICNHIISGDHQHCYIVSLARQSFGHSASVVGGYYRIWMCIEK